MDARGYINNTGDHQNHRNFADWHYPVQLSWPEEVQDSGATVTLGSVLHESNKGSSGIGTRTLNVKTIPNETQTPITLDLISTLKSNAALLASNFDKTSGDMNMVPSESDILPIIMNENFASSGQTNSFGQGILDAVLSLGGSNIETPVANTLIHKDKVVDAVNEMEKIAVYANYSNYSNTGYAQYTVYYTDHSNSGSTYGQAGDDAGGWWCCYNNHTNIYSNHSNTSNPIGTYSQSGYSQHGGAETGYSASGWWCCYDNHVNNYANHINNQNSNSGYANYQVGYTNYSDNYSNYSKVVS